MIIIIAIAILFSLVIIIVTDLGKLTQSCKPLVFSHPGISEWTIPGGKDKKYLVVEIENDQHGNQWHWASHGE